MLRRCLNARLLVLPLLAIGLWGCIPPARILSIAEQHPIDRGLVEFPAGYQLERYAADLTAPTAIAIDSEGSTLIAEGQRDEEVRIFGYRADGKPFTVYPPQRNPIFGFAAPSGWRMYGPVGGMVCHQGQIYVSHRDADGMGVITALDYQGHHKTIVGNLPAQGDYGVTDLAISPTNGRLYFGVGTATNSGVVGLDNWAVGWPRYHPLVHDEPWKDVVLYGYRFDSPNPLFGLFGPSDLAVTAIFQPFNHSNQTRVRGVDGPDGTKKPNGAIYSVSPDGGFASVEAFGIHNPRGLAVNEYGQIYFSNDGMEMRGTRPIKDDHDALLRLVSGTWYGWPDYTADLRSVSEPEFQPPEALIASSGYPELRPCIDNGSSGFLPPRPDVLLQGAFPSLSGAARIEVVPATWPVKDFRGDLLVALSGDRAPFATSGWKMLNEFPGYKVVRVDPDTHKVYDFVRNTAGKPRSQAGGNISLLERPIDVKIGPDGAIYILDFGQMEMRGGREHVKPGSGQIFRLVPVAETPVTPADGAGVEVRP